MHPVSPWANRTGVAAAGPCVLFGQGDAACRRWPIRAVLFGQGDTASGQRREGAVLFGQGDAAGRCPLRSPYAPEPPLRRIRRTIPRARSGWAYAQPMRTRIAKFSVPTPAAFK